VPGWNPSGYLWNAPDRIDVTVGGAAAAPSTSPVAAPEPAATHPTFERACRVCHDDDLSAQQRLTREGWAREVDKMIRWGARVTPEERGPLVEFLASRWGVR
jgi:cytochrome c5